MKLSNITYQGLKAALESLGFVFFDKGDYNVNIIGVRSASTASNSFDDAICLAYREQGKEVVKVYPATTDPGLYWLENPMRLDGTAILVAPQQVRGAYKRGLHNGKYRALRQSKPFAYVRDNNKDSRLDFYRGKEVEPGRVKSEIIFANLHRASEWSVQENVGKYSAACQVVQAPNDFDELMVIVDKAAELYGDSFTYTLIEEKHIS